MSAAALGRLAYRIKQFLVKTQARKKLMEFVEEHWGDLVQKKWVEDFIKWVETKISSDAAREPAAPADEPEVPPPPQADLPELAQETTASEHPRSRSRLLFVGGVMLIIGGGRVLMYGQALRGPPPPPVGLQQVLLPHPDGGGIILLRGGPASSPALMASRAAARRIVLVISGGIVLIALGSGLVLLFVFGEGC